MGYEYVLADVFTDRPFAGNQLAVFPRADGLSDATMQALAREFNFSEITFVLPPADDADFRVRIFTPAGELPFAGHPTVGTAVALVAEGLAEPGRLVLGEGIGPVAVDADGGFARLTITPALELPADVPPRPAVAAALSLPEDDVVDCWYASAGLRFCYVRLAAGAVDRAVLDRAVWSKRIAGTWAPHLYVFEGEPSSGSELYARSFVPDLGVGEDPATGSAAAGLVASLAARASWPDGSHRLSIDQGVLLGRPSRILAGVEVAEGELRAVTVGGPSVLVGRGSMAV